MLQHQPFKSTPNHKTPLPKTIKNKRPPSAGVPAPRDQFVEGTFVPCPPIRGMHCTAPPCLGKGSCLLNASARTRGEAIQHAEAWGDRLTDRRGDLKTIVPGTDYLNLRKPSVLFCYHIIFRSKVSARPSGPVHPLDTHQVDGGNRPVTTVFE